MIDGVVVKQLKVIPDERGFLMEILRADDPFFQKFGQVYLGRLPGRGQGLALPQDADRPLLRRQGHGQGRALRRPRGLADAGRGQRVLHGRAQPDPAASSRRGVLHGMKGIGIEPALPHQHARPSSTTTPSRTSSASIRTTTTFPTTGAARMAEPGDRASARPGRSPHPGHRRRPASSARISCSLALAAARARASRCSTS